MPGWTQRWPFELPQSVGTLSEVSKFHLLVNQNSITCLFPYNTNYSLYRTQSRWGSGVLIEDQPHHGWVSFVLHTLHHHLHPFLPQPHPTARQRAPPLTWGMWAQIQSPQLTSEARTTRTGPSPFQRDVGSFLDARRRNRGVGNARGDLRNWEAWLVKLWFVFFIPLFVQPNWLPLHPPHTDDVYCHTTTYWQCLPILPPIDDAYRSTPSPNDLPMTSWANNTTAIQRQWLVPQTSA